MAYKLKIFENKRLGRVIVPLYFPMDVFAKAFGETTKYTERVVELTPLRRVSRLPCY